MLTSRRAWISLFAISTLIASAAAACGGGGDTTSSSSNGGASATSSSGTSSGKGGEGGDLFPMSSSSSGGTGGAPVVCDPNPTQGTEVWAKAAGDASGQNGISVATDAAGNVFVAGAFSGSITFGATTLTSAGAADAFIAKLDPSGNAVWAKRFGDAKAQSALAVAVDTNGFVIVAGFFLGTINLGGSTFTAPGCCFEDVFLAKFDGNTGNHVWSKAFGDINTQRAFGLAVNANSDIAMVGTFQTNTDFGSGTAMVSNGGDDAYVAMFSAAGNFKWQKQIGSANNDKAVGVAFDASGNVLVAGTALGTVDMGGGMISPVGQEAAMVAKYDPNGAFLWGKLFGDSKAAALGIGADGSGNVLVAGDHEGAINFGNNPLSAGIGSNVFVTKLDGQGGHVWSHSYGDGSAQHTRGLVVDKGGLPIVTGNFAGMIDFGDGALTSAGTLDAFIAKLDTKGCQVWAKALGDATSQDAAGVTIDASNNTLVTGTFSGSMTIGSTTLTSAGMSDVFIAKFGP